MPVYEDATFSGDFVINGTAYGSDTCCGGEISIKITLILQSGTFASRIVKVPADKAPQLKTALAAKKSDRVSLQCVHRSDYPIETSSCGKYNVYDCEIHERCVLRRYPRTDPSIASCFECLDYTRKASLEPL